MSDTTLRCEATIDNSECPECGRGIGCSCDDDTGAEHGDPPDETTALARALGAVTARFESGIANTIGFAAAIELALIEIAGELADADNGVDIDTDAVRGAVSRALSAARAIPGELQADDRTRILAQSDAYAIRASQLRDEAPVEVAQ